MIVMPLRVSVLNATGIPLCSMLSPWEIDDLVYSTDDGRERNALCA
jgi:hypothetical protein